MAKKNNAPSRFAPRFTTTEISGVQLMLRAPTLREAGDIDKVGGTESAVLLVMTCARLVDGAALTRDDVLDMPIDVIAEIGDKIGSLGRVEKGLKKSSGNASTPAS